MMFRLRPLGRSILVAALMAALPARAAPTDICALLTPFLQSPPSHFMEMRGVKSGDNAWSTKAMLEADALNARCSINLYIKDRPDLDCEIKFDNGQLVEQDAFYRDAVTGFDYCLSNLNFGDAMRRVSERSDSTAMRTESVSWYKSVTKNYRQVAQFGGGVTKTEYKSPSSLTVKIELFFGEDKS